MSDHRRVDEETLRYGSREERDTVFDHNPYALLKHLAWIHRCQAQVMTEGWTSSPPRVQLHSERVSQVGDDIAKVRADLDELR